MNEVQAEINAIENEGERIRYCQQKSKKYVQQSAPAKYTRKKGQKEKGSFLYVEDTFELNIIKVQPYFS